MSNTEKFKEEVKSLLSGYLGSDEDTINYLVFKIASLHETYSEEVPADE